MVYFKGDNKETKALERTCLQKCQMAPTVTDTKVPKRRKFKFEKWNKNISYVANNRHNICSATNIYSR